MPEPMTDQQPISPRIARKRALRLRRAKAAVELIIDEIGAHAAVVILNDGLREALDRLDEEG